MPEVITRIPDALEMMKYGYFQTWKYPQITIAAADAVTITAAQTNTYLDRYTAIPPTEEVTPINLNHFFGSGDWCGMICHWSFEGSSRPDKVYFQVIDHGSVFAGQFKTDFVAGGYVSDSNIESYTILPPFDDSVDLQFWNATGAAAEDVWIDIALTFFLFPKENLEAVMSLSYANLFRSLGTKLDTVAELLGGLPSESNISTLQEIKELLAEMAGRNVKFERRYT